MNEVVGCVDMKDAEQHPVGWSDGRDETENSNEQENDTEKNRSCFDHFPTSLRLGTQGLWQSG
jgi:hypothetical protein